MSRPSGVLSFDDPAGDSQDSLFFRNRVVWSLFAVLQDGGARAALSECGVVRSERRLKTFAAYVGESMGDRGVVAVFEGQHNPNGRGTELRMESMLLPAMWFALNSTAVSRVLQGATLRTLYSMLWHYCLFRRGCIFHSAMV